MIRGCLMLLMLASQLQADPASTRGPVEIQRIPATAERITFDPEHPQSYIPKLNKGESAITVSRFDCRADFTHELISTKAAYRQTEVTIKLTVARVQLALQDLIYLPTNVRPPLRVHEEGHRVINERIFDQEADRIAYEASESVLAKTWTARGRDRNQGETIAIGLAGDELREEYCRRIAKRIAQVSDAFDEITKHGAKDVRVIDAIEEAFNAPPTSPTTAAAVTERTPPPAPRAAPSP